MRITFIKRRQVGMDGTADLGAARKVGLDNLLDLVIKAHNRLTYDQIEQFFLGGDVIVEGRLLDTHFRGNVARCRSMIALLLEHLCRRGNDLLLTLCHAHLLCRLAASATRHRARSFVLH
jgi:hypothetical protein